MEHKNPSLLRQLLGAVIGASLALVAYAGYKAVTPHVLTAYNSLQNPAATAESDTPARVAGGVDEEEYARIQARTQEILRTFGKAAATEEMSEEEMRDAVAQRRRELRELSQQADAQVPDMIEVSNEPVVPHEEVMEYEVMEEEIAEEMPSPESMLTAQTTENHADRSDAPALPSSGLGMWLFALSALAVAALLRYRKPIARAIQSVA